MWYYIILKIFYFKLIHYLNRQEMLLSHFNNRLAPIRNAPSNERDELLREIKQTDAEIDQKVYELYGLTEEERQIIEASLVSKS